MGAPGFPETLVSLLFCCSLLTSGFTLCNGSSDVRDFVLATTKECHFLNRTKQVRLLERYFYNQEEFVYFDSDKGYFVAKTELGKPDAKLWNENKDLIEQRKSAVETYCKYNYGIIHSITADRRVEPSIKISLMNQYEESHTKQHMLICNVFGFYPSDIEVKWYRNGQEETELVQSTEPYHNGDWSYQILVMLETEIQKGDTFTCEVHHSSLKAPHRVDWHPQSSDAAKNKMAAGIVGFVLGVVFFTVGLVIYMRGRKGQTSFPGQQNERFLSQ
ncbi:H-2 class II histocompatibility antigen, E-S beta chain-like [Bufo gargarizans]|uniref:H-2 class II histocompatibility antigen, E-S beta chain-like n=1 Tax=Bufo gargarizans TaxID=30331 RepID=UPI001CF1281A|nr:H-2 class II histocompatibility antigen, E-S beta chain-like [Bufo gargarizans]